MIFYLYLQHASSFAGISFKALHVQFHETGLLRPKSHVATDSEVII